MTKAFVTDTIHALASGALPAGVAVIRVSGPLVPVLCAEWIARPLPPRHATLVVLRDADGERLDDALAIRFPCPRSFTGEDVLELHCHGGSAVVRAVEHRLSELGSRPAEPGEFTMRAHRNGRIDLVEAERLADLIAAETEAQRRLAASDAGRRNVALYERWRAMLIEARALVEASLDFADEEDAPDDVTAEVATIVASLDQEMRAHLDGVVAREIVAHGLRVVLAGAPNAGKSSLLNALVDREAAIVTDRPGTTRDAIDVPLEIGGHRIVLIDTAGLRETDDAVERIGIERARARIADADLVLLLQAPDDVVDASSTVDGQALDGASVLRLATKRDLADPRTEHDVAVSVRTGEGLDELTRRLSAIAARRSMPADGTAPLAARHAAHVRAALDRLPVCPSSAGAWLAGEPQSDGPHRHPTFDERAGEDLRLAANEIGRITGSVDIEDVYGAIFSRFCMGK